MPKKTRKNIYVLEGKKYTDFNRAIARAVDMSLERGGEDVNVVEHGQTGTYAITVRAQAKQIS